MIKLVETGLPGTGTYNYNIDLIDVDWGKYTFKKFVRDILDQMDHEWFTIFLNAPPGPQLYADDLKTTTLGYTITYRKGELQEGLERAFDVIKDFIVKPTVSFQSNMGGHAIYWATVIGGDQNGTEGNIEADSTV